MDADAPPPHRSSRPLRRAVLALVLAAGACGEPPPSAAPGESRPAGEGGRRPNVVVLVMDTVRADRCSLLGYARPTTPSLDRLAAEAQVFADAWVPAGWTAPSHASLFTGLRPVHHGVTEGARVFLPPSATTLAELLRDAGYRTASFSNNLVVSSDFGLTQGFQHDDALFRDEHRPLPHCRTAHERARDYARHAHDDGKPFFVFVNDFEPHLAYEPPEDAAARFVEGAPAPDVLRAARAWDGAAALLETVGYRTTPPEVLALLPDLYDAEIAALDREVGAFVEGLRADGLLDDTLLVVTSDHGESLGEEGLWAHRFSLHRRIRHVPLLVRWPDGHAAGTVARELVRLEDVFPTALDVCGVPVPEGLDGVSLRAPLGGRVSRASQDDSRSQIAETTERFPGIDTRLHGLSLRAVYDGRHHLIEGSDGAVRLYDVAADPGETRNLADGEPEVVARLRALLDR